MDDVGGVGIDNGVYINKGEEKAGESRLARTRLARTRLARTLGYVVGVFKTESTKRINETRGVRAERIFHRNYYEHIIRSEKEYVLICQYIKNNPKNWGKDKENPNK